MAGPERDQALHRHIFEDETAYALHLADAVAALRALAAAHRDEAAEQRDHRWPVPSAIKPCIGTYLRTRPLMPCTLLTLLPLFELLPPPTATKPLSSAIIDGRSRARSSPASAHI